FENWRSSLEHICWWGRSPPRHCLSHRDFPDPTARARHTLHGRLKRPTLRELRGRGHPTWAYLMTSSHEADKSLFDACTNQSCIYKGLGTKSNAIPMLLAI